MKRFIDTISDVVRRAPVIVIVVAVVVTAVLGAASGRAGRDDGNEAFAPDAPELTTFDELGTLFGSGSDEGGAQVIVSTAQVIVSTDGGDVITLDGLAAVEAVREAVLGTEAELGGGRRVAMAELLSVQEGRPDFVNYLLPVQQAVQEGAPAPASDAEVKDLYRQALADASDEDRAFATGLLNDGADPDSATADKGLVLFFFQQGDLSDDDLTDVLAELGDEVVAAAPAGTSLEIFSFGLLFSDQDEFQQETGRLFMFAGLIIVVILMLVFWVAPRGNQTRLRSLRRAAADMGLTIATIFMAMAWMFGVGALLGPDTLGLIDDPNPMTDIVPILIIGLGVDYSIHLSSRYKEELGAGETVSPAIGHAIRTVGIALALATITTAVGFLTNVVNPVPALVVFGVYAAIGIGAAFILMLTFVASVRLLLDRRAERGGRLPAEALGANKERLLPTLIGRLSVLAERIPTATVAAALVLGALGVFGATRLETRFSVTDFVPEDNVALAALGTLQDDFGGGLGETTAVVVKGDVATVEGHNAAVAATAELANVPDVVTFAGRAQVDSPLSVMGALIDPDSPLFDADFAAAAPTLGLAPDLTVAAGTDVVALYDAAGAASNGIMSGVLHADGSGGYDAALFNVTTQAGEQGAGELRDSINAAFVSVEEAGLDAVATSDNIITKVVAEALESSQLSSLVITLAAAMLLLVINFWFESRRPMLGIITIFPVVLVVLWVFGLMAATGIPFGPVTATIAAIAIGIGVPYTIHVAHRFQEDRVAHADPNAAIESTTRNTGGALAGSAVTTAAGFGVLMTSSTVPFQQFGQVSVYAILLALGAAVLVLPSLLMLWDRWHRNRGEATVDEATVREIFDEEAPEESAPAMD